MCDTTFYEDIDSCVGREVTVSADVDEVLFSNAFTIALTTDTDVEPILVVSAEETTEMESDLTVAVTGTVLEAFDLVDAEEMVGVDPDDELYEAWDGEPYMEATSVDTSLASRE